MQNLGRNGYTTSEVLLHEVSEVRMFEPTLVTVAAGANDIVRGGSAERYRTHVNRIFARIIDAGVPPSSVIALPQPDWSLSRVAGEFGVPVAQLAGQIEVFNAILREEATKAGARYIDIFPRMREQARAGMLAGDGLHPSAEAYEEWAALLAERIALPESGIAAGVGGNGAPAAVVAPPGGASSSSMTPGSGRSSGPPTASAPPVR